jgi:hypothetical protein
LEKHYELALELAQEEIREKNPGEVTDRAAVEYADGVFSIPFLNTTCRVEVAEESVEVQAGDGSPAPTWLAILLLHYLLNASGEPLSGEYVDFRQLDGGHMYLPNFLKRAANRLARVFGEDAESLRRAGLALGGSELDLGDVSLSMPVLPRVPVYLVLWEGDDEFPPSSKILFDEVVNSYLPTEDVVVACQQLVTLLQAEV